MPKRPEKKKRKFEFDEALLDELLEQYDGPADMFGSEGLLESLKARLVERALSAEMTDHLGYPKHEKRTKDTQNARNGTTKKRVKTETGEMEIEVPRDRDSSFEPLLVPKGVRRLEGFDDMVVALYSRGMTTRDIQSQLKEIYKVEISPDLVSLITNEILNRESELEAEAELAEVMDGMERLEAAEADPTL